MITYILKNASCTVILIILGIGSAMRASAQTAPTITDSAPIDATVGFSYNFTYAVSGSPTPSFTISPSTLPAGLTISSTGVISGTPTTVATYTGTVTASNGVGTAATQTLDINVWPSYTDPLQHLNWQVYNYYFNGKNTPNLQGRLYVPTNYNPSQSYPLVVFFHGSGEEGTDNTAQVSDNISGLMAQAKNTPFFLYAPQLPAGNGSWSAGYTYPAYCQVAHLELLYNIDPTRIWATGLSLGGEGAWYGLTFFPNALDGGITCSGSQPLPALTTANYDALVGKPYWGFVNSGDQTVNPGQTETEVNGILTAEGKPNLTFPLSYSTYPDNTYFKDGTTCLYSYNNMNFTQFLTGNVHDSWDPAYDLAGLYTWMASFTNPSSTKDLQPGDTIYMSTGWTGVVPTGTVPAGTVPMVDSSGNYWNSLPFGYHNTLESLFPFAVEKAGKSTGVSLDLTTPFNFHFTNSPTLTTPYDSVIGNQGWTTILNTEADFKLHGLVPGGVYRLTFFGSYNVYTYTNTNWTRYTAGTQYADLDTYNNTTSKAVVDNVIADSTGTIPIRVAPKPGTSAQTAAINVIELLRDVVDLADFRIAAGLATNGSQDTALDSSGDGVSNIMKFAFNMTTSGTFNDLSTYNNQIMTSSGTSGLPLVQMNGSNQLTITFVRRIASNNPGITYIPEASSDLVNWTTMDGVTNSTVSVTNINNLWERDTYTDTVGGTPRFLRIRITVP